MKIIKKIAELEQYISTISTLERVTIVIAAGNEGDSAHHIGGNLKKQNTISINVAADEPGIVLNLYKPVLSDISIRITSPTAATSGDIVVRVVVEYRQQLTRETSVALVYLKT